MEISKFTDLVRITQNNHIELVRIKELLASIHQVMMQMQDFINEQLDKAADEI